MTKILNPNHRYVCGFIFNLTRDKVLLIRKVKPIWQAGRLNGIGGRIEHGESSHAAMTRECMEECGLLIPDSAWSLFVTLRDQRGWLVDFFYAVRDGIGDAITTTDEAVEVVPVSHLGNCMTNLRWLIPMALSMRDETCKRFKVQEA